MMLLSSISIILSYTALRHPRNASKLLDDEVPSPLLDDVRLQAASWGAVGVEAADTPVDLGTLATRVNRRSQRYAKIHLPEEESPLAEILEVRAVPVLRSITQIKLIK